MNPVPPEARGLARWLLLCEAGPSGKAPEAEECEVTRVCEKLRKPLSALAGVIGYRSLLSRALALARTEDASLDTVIIREDGTMEGLCPFESQSCLSSGAKRGEVLVAHLIGLLITFIGPGLTLRLVRDVWPDASLGGTDSEMER